MSTVTPTLGGSDVAFLEPTFGRAARIWWALLWRGILISVGIGIVIGFVEGLGGTLMGIPSSKIMLLSVPSGVLIGIPVAIWVVQMVLRKRFRDFSIRLIASP